MRMILMVWLGCAAALAAEVGSVERDFRNPPAECRPHTRWWWMGNALSKDDITYQLGEMQAKGIGGVEQITVTVWVQVALLLQQVACQTREMSCVQQLPLVCGGKEITVRS